MVRLILSIVLSLFLVGCFSQDLEKVGAEIVDSLNNKDYDKLWDKYIDDGTKAQASSYLEGMKSDPTSALIFSMLGIPEDRIDNITPKECFGYLTNLFMSMGDLEPDAERLVLVYKGVELVDEDTAIILLEDTSRINKLDLVKIDGKWYLNYG